MSRGLPWSPNQRRRRPHGTRSPGRSGLRVAGGWSHRKLATAAVRMLLARLDDLAAVDETAAVGTGDLHQQRPNPARCWMRRHRGQCDGAARVARSIFRFRCARTFTHRKQTPTSGCSPSRRMLACTVRSPQHQHPGTPGGSDESLSIAVIAMAPVSHRDQACGWARARTSAATTASGRSWIGHPIEVMTS